MSALTIEWVTPPGVGALHVLEVSGADAVETLGCSIVGVSIRELGVGVARRAEFVDRRGERIDDGLIWRPEQSPRFVLTFHGNPHLVRAWIDNWSSSASEPSRAYVGPSDLRTEIRQALEFARTPGATALIARQGDPEGGGLLSWANDLLRRADAASDFEEIRSEARGVEARVSWGRAAVEPADVVIVGPPNAGKSTLFNAIVGHRRSVTADSEGTTRDVIREIVDVGDVSLRFHDVAGLREASDPVEVEGVRRAEELRDRAAVVVELVRDATTNSERDRRSGELAVANRSSTVPSRSGETETENRITVLSHADLRTPEESAMFCGVSVSGLTGVGIPELLRAVCTVAWGFGCYFPTSEKSERAGGSWIGEPIVPFTARQLEVIRRLRHLKDKATLRRISRELIEGSSESKRT